MAAPVGMAASRFLSLPIELRHHVYNSLYSSLTLTYPNFGCTTLSSLSRQVRDESTPFFYKNVNFNFRNTKDMVDYLTSIDSTTLCQLRHISVRGHPFPVYPVESHSCYYTHNFSTVLQLFPGLRLSTLTVRDTYHEPGVMCDKWGHAAAYEEVKNLIDSDGFRELIYVSVGDRFLKSKPEERQPSTWNKTMRKRDGNDSGAAVEMFRVTKNGRVRLDCEYETVRTTHRAFDGASDESSREFSDGESDTESERGYIDGQPISLCVRNPEEQERIEVVVRRGKGVDYVQSGKSLSVYEDRLHELFKTWTWKAIKEKDLYLEVWDDDPCSHL